MGQRTQMVLKLKDFLGRTRVKVYHEQWGFGNTMPKILMQFIPSIHYGLTAKNYCEQYRKPRIVNLTELKAMDKEKKEETLRLLEQTSIFNLGLNSYETTEEYIGKYVELDKDGNFVEDYYIEDGKRKNSVPLLEYDFDIYNPTMTRLFTGDNNDGLALMSVREVTTPTNYGIDINYELAVGFLKDGYVYNETDQCYELSIEDYERFFDVHGYTSQFQYYDKKFADCFSTICDTFEVEQLGKAPTKKTEEEKVEQ